MHLSWNEIRVRAAGFVQEWWNTVRERSDTQSFYNDFFEIFGVKRRSVARYERHVRKLDNRSGYIDLFWPGVLLVEQKSAGRQLTDAYDQAGEYFDALKESERPRYILVSDFQSFELHDLDERKTLAFPLKDLPDHVEAFGFILGVQRRTFRDQDPVNIQAAELVGRLHDALFESGYHGHDLERLLVRIVFCLFADDTGIFEPRDIFLEFIETRTGEDGSDTGARLIELFQVLDTPEDKRQKTRDEDLTRFPYINGDLFNGPLRIPAFDSSMRRILLDACNFDWSNISPAIFGALFQSIMDPEERREIGAHYTTEKNILKVIEPLFMDDLRAEFIRIKGRKQSLRRLSELQHFQKKLGRMRYFDPACGCGNFLIIAYRELRLLEIELLQEMHQAGQLDALVDDLSLINVDQFYGIELKEFPVRIAETALWMMDHIMNNRLSLEFGQIYARIPLQTAPHIVHGDALETNWNDLLSPDECSFVFGNPPFSGQSFQNIIQRDQMRRLLDPKGKKAGSLDYVAAWFILAGEYVRQSHAKIGFVATNSITQGEQSAQLWPILLDRYKLEIAFAHRTFAWGSDARGKAHVHVIIIGLECHEDARIQKRLFSYPDVNGEPEETQHSAISPYLFGAEGLGDPHLVVTDHSKPINGLPEPRMGTKPVVGQFYLFSAEEKTAFIRAEPGASVYFRPFIGSREYLQGKARYILHLTGINPSELAKLPMVQERVAAVRQMRAESRKVATRALANYPTEYEVSTIPTAPFLIIPETSSERREYVPIGWLEPPVIPSNSARIIEDANILDFAILTSSMHMAWLRHVGGRLKSDYRYTIGLVYNTFPIPPGFNNGSVGLSKLEPLARAIIDARNAHPGATLADLYDPNLMPPNLYRAHQALDKAVDRLYRKSGFASERERVEHLFMLYEKLRAPLEAGMKTKPKRTRKVEKLKSL